MTFECRLLIVDLDNTLYDWVSSFVPSVYAMIEKASEILQLSSEQIIAELQLVNQIHGDTEHPAAICEIESVRRRFIDEPNRVIEVLSPALVCFRETSTQLLELYPGVEAKLKEAKERKIPVVAYTDARVSSSLFRVNALGLKPLLAKLYTPDQRVNSHIFDASDAELLTVLPHTERKPNPATLLDICAQCGVAPADAIYVGDSIVRDIHMARQAGVLAAWAKYGLEYDPRLWEKLVAITHWTDEDVRREAEVRSRAGTVVPNIILERFSDLRLEG